MIKRILPLILSTSLFIFNSNVTTAAAASQQIQAFFLPKEQQEMKAQLDFLLNVDANKQVLIAMYWITDYSIIDNIILLKKKGIDVQIIFDESSSGSNILMKKLLENDIVPLILPSNFPRSETGLSGAEKHGLMHNKFFVVDNRIVWTGSANFTKRGLGPYTDSFNNENILIINNEDLAEKFNKAFFDIEKEISDTYIKIIENNPPDQIADWLSALSRALYKHNPRFKELVYTRPTKDNLRSFLKERTSIGQRSALKRLGYSDIAIEYMSPEEAKKIIIEAERRRAASSQRRTQ